MGDGVERLNAIPGVAQMNTMRPDVSHLYEPPHPKLTLQGQVPLLGVGNAEVSWHFQHKKVLRGVDAGSSSAGIGGILSAGAVRGDKTGEPRQTRQPGRRKRTRGRHRVGVRRGRSGKEVGKTNAGSGAEEDDGNKRGLEAELVDGTNVFADIVDAVTPAQSRGVVTEDIPGKTDARSQAGGDAVAEGGSGGI